MVDDIMLGLSDPCALDTFANSILSNSSTVRALESAPVVANGGRFAISTIAILPSFFSA